MISKEHKKHSHLARPGYGNFSRNEWSLVGASDTIIEELAANIIKELSQDYHCAYAGASGKLGGFQSSGPLNAGAFSQYLQTGPYHQFSFVKPLNQIRGREMFAAADLVIVNGNHYEAKAQVLVIDPSSGDALKKRLPGLTGVQLVLLTEQDIAIPEFVKEAIPHWQSLPLYGLYDINSIAAFFRNEMQQATPVLKGLVLAGGHSVRMGLDKGTIKWHQEEQRFHMAALLQGYCDDVFISCRPGQCDELDGRFKKIEDSFTGLGPYGAILSAFREQPDAAWFVIACDMPLVDDTTLAFLTSHRNVSSIATCFESPRDGSPEPLITIWEPRSYPLLLSMLGQGYTCPRKVLKSNDVLMLKPPQADALTNVNTPEERERVLGMIGRNRE